MRRWPAILLSVPVLALAATVIGQSCGEKKADSPAASTPTTATGPTGTTPTATTGTIGVNTLAGAYPEGFAISALPATAPATSLTTLPSVAGTVSVQNGLIDDDEYEEDEAGDDDDDGRPGQRLVPVAAPLPPIGATGNTGDPCANPQTALAGEDGDEPPESPDSQDDEDGLSLDAIAPCGNANPNPPVVQTNPAGDDADRTVSDKVAAAQRKLQGTDECFDTAIFNDPHAANVSCYTPDGDLNVNLATGTLQSRPTTESGEACMPAFTRATLATLVKRVDLAAGLVLAMFCQAKKDGKATDLPGVDAATDLKETLAKALGAAYSVESATVKRLANRDTRAVYRTDLRVTFANAGTTQFREVHVLHSPSAAEGNLNYVGRMWTIAGGTEPKQGPNDRPKIQYVSVTYARTGSAAEPRLRSRLVSAGFVRNDETPEPGDLVYGKDPISATGELDLNEGSGADGAFPKDANNQLSNTIEQLTFAAFDLNPLTNAGKLMFMVNPGGNYHESARGMVVNVKKQDDSALLAGCSISGAAFGDAEAISIRMAQKIGYAKLYPAGYYHPNIQGDKCPGNQSTSADAQSGACQQARYVYKQCFKQDAATNAFAIDPNLTDNDADGFDIIKADTGATVAASPDFEITGL